MSHHEYDETPAPTRMWVVVFLLAVGMWILIGWMVWDVMTWWVK